MDFGMHFLPNLIWVEQRGAFIPNIPVPKNWKLGIPKFYRHCGREETEEDARNLADSLETITGKPDIRLGWDNKEDNEGLIVISLGTHPAMYFQRGRWVEHNLGTPYSLMGMAILLNYYKRLSGYIPEQ